MADSVSDAVSESKLESVFEFEFDSLPGSPSGLTDDSGSLPSLTPYPVLPHCSSCPMLDRGIICATCAQLSYKQLCTPEGQRYHEAWSNLVEKAAEGCHLCTFFVTTRGAFLTTPWRAGPLFLRIHANCLDLFQSDSDVSWRCSLCLAADIDGPLPKLAQHVNRQSYPDRACDQAIDKILTWIIECETTHPNCRKAMIPSLPSRVLDLFHENSSQSICLVEGKGLKAEYATLSYCWGREAENANGQISSCTSQNISQLFEGVSIHALPLMYRDAVIMTQRLGKRYLWIDSLCIIQDSKEDWSKECPRMADIYANSFLTISAASSRSKQEGFIKATMFETQAKLTTLPGTQGEYIYVRPLYCLTPPTPLMDRAWTFQERLQSTRLLHLTSLDMLFQCDYHRRGSCANLDCYPHYGNQMFQNICPWIFRWPDGKNLWYNLVEDYAHLELTYEKDRLPALSSTAQFVQQRLLQDGLRANYVAGLWETDLVFGLLWSVLNRGKFKTKESSTYVAPTWSWAAHQREGLEWNLHADRDLLQLRVINIQTHLSTSNLFGEISSAYLTVDAPLRKTLTKEMQILESFLPVYTLQILFKDFAKVLFAFDAGYHKIPTSGPVWLLPCTKDAVLEEDELAHKSVTGDRDIWDGLALDLVDEKKQIYKRIGVFAICQLLDQRRTWHSLGFINTKITIV